MVSIWTDMVPPVSVFATRLQLRRRFDLEGNVNHCGARRPVFRRHISATDDPPPRSPDRVPTVSCTGQCGNEEANVDNIVIKAAGYEVTAEGVFTYRVNDEGRSSRCAL
jgi:hypothetical protein